MALTTSNPVTWAVQRESARWCPHACAGLGSERMRRCRGFDPVNVSFDGVDVPGGYTGKAWPHGVSCTHLEAAESARGWRGRCGHPRGLPSTWGDYPNAAP
jgi:hypothetical protein